MSKHLRAGVAMLALMPLTAAAASPFDGIWKADFSTAKLPTKPDIFALRNGIYTCQTCTPPVSVRADGSDHPVSGHPEEDTVAITVMDAHTIVESQKKDGKTVYIQTTTVTPDGKTASFAFTDTTNPDAAPVTAKGRMIRVGAAPPASAHAITGAWQTIEFADVSDSGTVMSFKTDANGISLSTPAGLSYTAKLDGTDAPFTGDPGVTTVSVKRLGTDTIEETDKRDGKPVYVMKMTVSTDGKTMAIVSTDKLRDTTTSMIATKQG